jgi:hypothetical protein
MSTIGNIQNAIHAWFSSATGLTTVWSHQNHEHPPYPYGVLTLIAFDDNIQAYDDIEINGYNNTMEIVGSRRFSIGCQVIGKDRTVYDYITRAVEALNNPISSEVFVKRQTTEITVSSAASGVYSITLYGSTAYFTAGVMDTVTTIRDGLYLALLSTNPLLNRGFLFEKSGTDKLKIRWKQGYIFSVTVSSRLSTVETVQAVNIARINEDDIASYPIEHENGWLFAGRFDAHFYNNTNQVVLGVPMVTDIKATINTVEIDIL